MREEFKVKNLSTAVFLPEHEVSEVVIGVHGFAGDKESSVLLKLADSLYGAGIALVIFDLPCHGKNDNSKPINLADCVRSIFDIYEFAKEKFNGKISFFATSFGAYLLLSALSEKDVEVNKIILRAPAIFMGDVLENVIIPEHGETIENLKNHALNLGYENALLVDEKFLADLKTNDLMKKYNKNYYFYVIQGKKDTTVSWVKNAKFFEKNCKENHEFFYFENADHRFKGEGELDEIVRITLKVLTEK